MTKGFFIVDRKLIDRAYAHSPKCGVLMMVLIRLANYGKTTATHAGKTIELQPGQLVSSLKYLSEQSGMSIDEVRTALRFPHRSHMITTQTHRDGTLITICNWEEIQRKNFDVPHTSHTLPFQIPTLESINNKQETLSLAAKERKRSIKSPKEPKLLGPIESLKEHADVLATVPHDLQHGWIKLLGSSSAVNEQITKCKNWCVAKNKETRSWKLRLNNWMNNAEPSPTAPPPKQLPKFEGV
jgi:hypothetical protein